MNFQDKLDKVVKKNNSLVCVGLDPVLEKIPQHLQTKTNPFFEFNKAIIDATHDLVCVYKPNSAFYEALGDRGVAQLKMTFDYINEHYSDIPTILDAKRADIGNTNEGYSHYCFEYLGADAVTLQPYLGGEALQPFFDRKDKGIIILCRTSNPGAGEIQDLKVDGETIYNIVAKRVVSDWNKNGNCMLVVGATYPDELKTIRKIAGEMTFLVPGVGSQGGEVESTIKAGLNSKKNGMMINASRSVIFASSGADFAQAARRETEKLKEEINKYRQN